MTPQEAIDSLGLTVEATFIPQNYKADEKEPKLHWRVALMREGREVLATEYSAGCAHAPAYKQGHRSIDEWAAVVRECNTGFRWSSPEGFFKRGPILPNPLDVISCLILDASALDHPTFEEWARDFGYDPDSRKGERIYRQSLEIGLKLRAAIGDAGLETLREAFSDY